MLFDVGGRKQRDKVVNHGTTTYIPNISPFKPVVINAAIRTDFVETHANKKTIIIMFGFHQCQMIIATVIISYDS